MKISLTKKNKLKKVGEKQMTKKNEWLEDSEALSIAMDVVDKFNDTFCGIDLSRIRFLRILGRKNGKDIKVSSVDFPLNIDIPYLYYIEIDDNKWKVMSEAKRNLTVFSGLYEIAPGGMDPESNSYGKKRPLDIKDYAAVIAAAGGRYDWKEVNATGIHDILMNDEDQKDIDNFVKNEMNEGDKKVSDFFKDLNSNE